MDRITKEQNVDDENHKYILIKGLKLWKNIWRWFFIASWRGKSVCIFSSRIMKSSHGILFWIRKATHRLLMRNSVGFKQQIRVIPYVLPHVSNWHLKSTRKQRGSRADCIRILYLQKQGVSLFRGMVGITFCQGGTLQNWPEYSWTFPNSYGSLNGKLM